MTDNELRIAILKGLAGRNLPGINLLEFANKIVELRPKIIEKYSLIATDPQMQTLLGAVAAIATQTEEQTRNGGEAK